VKFLDSKEQVVELELTPHGKTLLSEGIFKPVYYSFYDQDILYDSLYTNTSIGQSDIESRIQEKTPRLSPQPRHVAADKTVRRIMFADLLEPDKNQVLRRPLGTSTPQNDKLPAWSVGFLNGELTGSSYYSVDSDEGIHYIPQLDVKITYDVKVKTAPSEIPDPASPPAPEFDTRPTEMELMEIHPDNTYVEVKEDYLLIYLAEKNVTFSKENYDLEVYEVQSNGNTQELQKLSFMKDEDRDDLFSEVPQDANSDMVEHYVNVEVDDEIDPFLLASIVKEKVGSLYLDKRLRRAQRTLDVNPDRRDIYASVVDPTEHCEE
jgi:hypothetical protein